MVSSVVSLVLSTTTMVSIILLIFKFFTFGNFLVLCFLISIEKKIGVDQFVEDGDHVSNLNIFPNC